MEQKDLYRIFIRLRWYALFCQLLILFCTVYFFKLSLPEVTIAGWLMLIPVTNFLIRLQFFERLSETSIVGGLLAFDTLILTFVLCEAGGATNPFTIVFLLHIVLAAVMLNATWTWVISVLSSLGFSLLFVFSRPVPEWEIHGRHQGFSLHLHGMLFAYVTVALLVSYFLNQIVGDLRKKEERLHRLQILASSQQRLAALTTITANVAHELGTPLSTIAVVSHELERTINKRFPEPGLLEDISLLKSETMRCKEILHVLSEKTGELFGESPQSVTVSDLINDALQPLEISKSNYLITGAVDVLLMKVPRRALSIAIRAVIKNSIEASKGSAHPIALNVFNKGDAILLEVIDKGLGMDTLTLERIGEPFFTTKGVGNGLGLGMYLLKLTLEQIGGNVAFESKLGKGTQVRLIVPVDCSLYRVYT